VLVSGAAPAAPMPSPRVDAYARRMSGGGTSAPTARSPAEGDFTLQQYVSPQLPLPALPGTAGRLCCGPLQLVSRWATPVDGAGNVVSWSPDTARGVVARAEGDYLDPTYDGVQGGGPVSYDAAYDDGPGYADPGPDYPVPVEVGDATSSLGDAENDLAG
jgi:hypothetical protein